MLLLTLSLRAYHREYRCFLLYQVLLLLLLLHLRYGDMGLRSLLREQLLCGVVKGVRLRDNRYDRALTLISHEVLVVTNDHLGLDVEARRTRGYATHEILSEGDALVTTPTLHHVEYGLLLVVQAGSGVAVLVVSMHVVRVGNLLGDSIMAPCTHMSSACGNHLVHLTFLGSPLIWDHSL